MMYHCYTDYLPSNPDTRRRMLVAQSTWPQQLWKEVPIQDRLVSRMWTEEGKSLPYLKDLLDKACEQLVDDDILVHTNDDTCLHTRCAFIVATMLQSVDACFSFRYDFPRLEAPIYDEGIMSGRLYAGSDLHAFRVGWWRKHRDRFPDMVVGLEAWDPCMRVLIQRTHHGRETHVPGIIYHERHGSYWEDPANRYRLTGQRMCLQRAAHFLRTMGVNPRDFGIPEGMLLQARK